MSEMGWLEGYLEKELERTRQVKIVNFSSRNEEHGGGRNY